MNAYFPTPRGEPSDAADDTEGSFVAQFVYDALFPKIAVATAGTGQPGPPPVDSVFGQGDGDEEFIIKRRKLSYLGNILRSWQRIVADPVKNDVPFPTIGMVEGAFISTAPTFINYEHHRLVWRSCFFIKVENLQNKLVIHLANDGFLYIPDKELEATPWGKPDVRHPKQPDGWSVLKPKIREEAFVQLQDFSLFADAWFGSSGYQKTILYNAEARRIDICFLSKVGLEFSFERDWPSPDESDIWF